MRQKKKDRHGMNFYEFQYRKRYEVTCDPERKMLYGYED